MRLASALRERLLGSRPGLLAERGYLAVKLARTSGLGEALRPRGVVELARIGVRGRQNPALAYRLHARNTPRKVALVAGVRQITFGALDARIDAVGHGLRRRGVRPGDRVLLALSNRVELVEASAAAARVGAGAVTVSYRSTAAELDYLIRNSGAKVAVFDAASASAARGARATLREQGCVAFGVADDGEPELEGFEPYVALAQEGLGPCDDAAGDQAAVVVYTSGTTGRPKGAVREFPKDTMAAVVRFLLETPMRADDVHLVACPLYHSTAYGFLTMSHILGATAVLLPEWKPEAFLAAVDAHAVTTTAVVPTMLHRVLALGDDVRGRYRTRSLRAIFSGGAPLPGPLATEVLDAFGEVLFNFYGATETGLVTLAKPADLRAAPGTIGRALPGNVVRLLDDAGRDVGEGEVGELWVRNHLQVSGYHGDRAATDASRREGAGFSVGDLARRDGAGRYFLEGRKRDMIISGGVNVYPAEVEGVLEAHPAVAEVAVVGAPDPEWGERVRAFVVPRAGQALDAEEVRAFAKARLGGAKVPRDVVVLEELPRNPTGKVLKRELRERR